MIDHFSYCQVFGMVDLGDSPGEERESLPDEEAEF